MPGSSSVRVRPMHSPVTLMVCASRRVLNHKPIAWVFENEAAALMAGAQFADEAWFLLQGAHSDPDDAMRALRSGRLLLSHSARAPVPLPRSGPGLRKCPVVSTTLRNANG